MPKDPDPKERRTVQLGVMLTPTEKAELDRVARDLGMSWSNAGRYLIKRGLTAHNSITFNDEGE